MAYTGRYEETQRAMRRGAKVLVMWPCYAYTSTFATGAQAHAERAELQNVP